ncbi:sarcosine oxidase / L-pipecolate oxidase [Geosmithia morbida]|uniref:Sarcosine oxidase / L-pipecolate oxidase n=1 Tax=Geosmithia morbida TaxID=1094350 RepID=A0A9P4YZH7_9HYPO|nr:sarcosine oxidase / L-pipecolate oxidase [Geosmithia morbida]KAF4125397.1 sarcosine oxidase / L-pipecolate oxidase [Geosmithia morbida]
MTTPKRILIVGGGTFGLSTAYHLAKSGYTSVSVIDSSEFLPSNSSAGHDLNKIVRAEDENPRYADLALEAMKLWQEDPLFAPYYHQVGYLLANSPGAPDKAKKTLAKSLSNISQREAWKGRIRPIESRQDIRELAPAFDGPMDWRGYFNTLAGWVHATDSMHAVYAACCDMGVRFLLGDGVERLAFEGDECVGVHTASGKLHPADVVVVTLGASVAGVVPELAPQITAKAFAVAHVQLTPDEAARLRGIPVTYARDLGFLFEPDPRTGLLKICPMGAGITNYRGGSISLPPDDNSYIPSSQEESVRRLLRDTLPALADRPLVNKHMCWIADTRDSCYVIDYIPGKKGVVVATGDSGTAFKMLPNAGGWVKKLIEEGEQKEDEWRWKDFTGSNDDVSWRVGEPYDLSEEQAK